ncbi:MAG: transglutaminase-like domain-containing protein [bacterium]
MIDKKQLPFLLNLIDDDTDEVRRKVFEELSRYGLSLEIDLKEYYSILSENSHAVIEPLIENNRREWLVSNWPKWKFENDEYTQLESAINIISVYQLGLDRRSSLRSQLDRLAEDFLSANYLNDEFDLSYFLFEEKGLKGDKDNYYDPLNSNPVYAIENKKGLPITLCIIYMLVGSRLDFKIEGCNFPGHFMSKIWVDNEMILVDCFNDGRMLFENNIRKIAKDSADAVMDIVNMNTSSALIIKRVINNLINAYENKKDKTNVDLFMSLFDSTFPEK